MSFQDQIEVIYLAPQQLCPGCFQPRRSYSDKSIEELAASIRQMGLLEPICVRPLGDVLFQIIAGERRWRAAKLAGVERLPCRVFAVTEDQAFVMALAENLQRNDLTSLDEALAYQVMLDRGIANNRATIARLLGVARQRITQRMKLLELDESTQRRLQAHPEILTEYHGRLLWHVKDLAARHRLADEAIEMRSSGRCLKAQVDEYHRQKEIEKWVVSRTGLPRSYKVSLPGFSLGIDYSRANLSQVLDIMGRATQRLTLLTEADRGRQTPDQHV